MKTMTCREMGGECDQKISANSSKEMAQKMTEHVEQKHPDTAKKMENMSSDEHKKWEDDFKQNWDEAEEKK